MLLCIVGPGFMIGFSLDLDFILRASQSSSDPLSLY